MGQLSLPITLRKPELFLMMNREWLPTTSDSSLSVAQLSLGDTVLALAIELAEHPDKSGAISRVLKLPGVEE